MKVCGNYLICSVTSTCGNTRSGAIIDDIIDLQQRMVRLEGLVDSGEFTGPVGPQGEQGDVKLVSTNLPAYHRLDITRADGTDLATIKVSAFGSGTQLFMCNSVVIERDQFHTVLHVTVTQEAMWCVCEFF